MTVRFAFAGVGFGFVLNRVGFGSYDEIRSMFTLSDPRLLLAFATAVVILAAVFRVRAPPGIAQPLRGRIVLGSILFGTGWALCGACPGIIWVQLGEGQLAAIASLGGMLVGSLTFGWINRRWLKWGATSCAG